jgi:hypothetical protein
MAGSHTVGVAFTIARAAPFVEFSEEKAAGLKIGWHKALQPAVN